MLAVLLVLLLQCGGASISRLCAACVPCAAHPPTPTHPQSPGASSDCHLCQPPPLGCLLLGKCCPQTPHLCGCQQVRQPVASFVQKDTCAHTHMAAAAAAGEGGRGGARGQDDMSGAGWQRTECNTCIWSTRLCVMCTCVQSAVYSCFQSRAHTCPLPGSPCCAVLCCVVLPSVTPALAMPCHIQQLAVDCAQRSPHWLGCLRARLWLTWLMEWAVAAADHPAPGRRTHPWACCGGLLRVQCPCPAVCEVVRLCQSCPCAAARCQLW